MQETKQNITKKFFFISLGYSVGGSEESASWQDCFHSRADMAETNTTLSDW
jgi:hypothetical protein